MRISELLAFVKAGRPRGNGGRGRKHHGLGAAQVLEKRQLLVADNALIGDINMQAETAGSTPQELTEVNGVLFFTAEDKTHGRELWKKVGTSPAVLVKDVRPGTDNSALTELTAVGSTLFFIADDGIHGRELWKSDGTANGTVIVKDYARPSNDPGAANWGAGGDDLTNVNGKLFYRSGSHFNEDSNIVVPYLMTSDGTAEGTGPVTLSSGLPFSWALFTDITPMGSQAYYVGGDGELWKSDGTPEGTVLVKDVYAGGGSSRPSHITVVGQTVYFVAEGSDGSGREIWKTDGTEAGTVRVTNFNEAGNSEADHLANVNGTLYFSAYSSVSGRELWKTNGTESGTVLVKDIVSGTGSSTPSNLMPVGSTLYFSASDGVTGEELWKTNGTAAGTVLVGHSGTSANFTPRNLTNIGGTLYFSAFTFEHGYEVWKSNGTTAGTNVFKDLNPGAASSAPSQFTVINGILYYSAIDTTKGREVWQHDIAANSASVDDIKRGTIDSGARDFLNVNGTMYFVADDGIHGAELWKTSGLNTSLVKDVFPGAAPSGIREMTNVNGLLYFSAGDDVSGVELWKSDGTPAGTVRVRDIYQSPNASSYPLKLTNLNGTLIFSAINGENGREMWRSDGTEAGTVLIKDIVNGGASSISSSFEMTAVGNVAFFTANDGSNGEELWKTDGTTAGTILVKDIRTATTGSAPTLLTNVNGRLYFTADDGTSGRELWQSNGTDVGTILAKDTNPGANGSAFKNFVNAAGKLFFESYSATGSWDLFCRATPTSDTINLQMFNLSGHVRYVEAPLTAVGNVVYFAQLDNRTGTELWKSDGTLAGTQMVKDIVAIPVSSINGEVWGSNPLNLINVNGTLYFTANDMIKGQELWKSDGTSAGTKPVADLTGDAGSSHPENLTVVNNRIYMTAVTESTGREVFAVLDQPEGTNGNDSFELTYDSTNTLGTVTVTVSSDGGPVKNLGAFPMSVPLKIDGLEGDDKITVKATGGNDTITTNISGLNVNGAGLQLKNIESRILAGMAGDDRYRFDTDSSLGVYMLNESSGGVDTLDFGSTENFSINLSLGVTLNQFVNPNLILGLSSATAFENVIGGAQNDILRGNSLANVITGGSGYDNMTGSTGDDTYVFSATTAFEEDVLFEYADQGTDALTFSSLNSQVTLSLGSSSVQASHVNRTIKLNATNTFENLTGGTGHDVLSGNSRNNLLTGGPGNDIMSGQAGNDTLAGGVGDDTYVFNAASALEVDSLLETAGQGSDTLSFALMTTAINLNLGTIAEQQVHTNRKLKLSSSTTFENAVGGSASDTLSGNSLNNLLIGGNGHDIIVGSSGHDNLQGGAGRDLLIGGLGLDTLDGGADDDILIAGRTTRDNNTADLGIIRNAWTSAQAYATRVANLRTGVSSPIVSLRAKLNVLNDAGEDDVLTGGSGTDWFLKALDDTITDLFAGELVDAL